MSWRKNPNIHKALDDLGKNVKHVRNNERIQQQRRQDAKKAAADTKKKGGKS